MLPERSHLTLKEGGSGNHGDLVETIFPAIGRPDRCPEAASETPNLT